MHLFGTIFSGACRNRVPGNDEQYALYILPHHAIIIQTIQIPFWQLGFGFGESGSFYFYMGVMLPKVPWAITSLFVDGFSNFFFLLKAVSK